MARISFDNVRKVYPNGYEALKGLSLTVNDGEFLVLVGPSGCGKSTALRLIAGLESPTSGSIRIGDAVVNDVEPKDRDIAMVFQNYALYPHMTVRRNMGFALSMRGLPQADVDRRVVDTARTLGLHEHLDRKPAELSGGQRQRVALGRAIVREPKAFLFDEPLSNLDAKLRVSTRAELKALHRRLRTTCVYVTHDQEEAMTLGDRIVVMSRGEVQQTGAPLEVFRHPVNRFVAGFVGTPPMNFIEGTLDRVDSRVRFRERADRDGVSFTAPDQLSARLAPHAEKPVVLGVRPGAFRIAPPDAPGAWSLPVILGEPLGECVDVRCRTGAHDLIARLPADAATAIGDRVALMPDPAHMHWFEPGDFGRNVLDQ